MICGLLGRKLGHSYSPLIHTNFGNYQYKLFEKEPEELGGFLKNGEFTGINVTMPYKKDVIPFCDALTDRAKMLGAVNTIVRRDDGSLIGHNTDFYGFWSMVTRTGISIQGKKALVLGSGGASATAVAVLKEMGAEVIVISRTGANNYTNIACHSDAQVIVNTTPVGMYPNTGVSPVDLGLFPCLSCVLDVVYNPARTKLLLDAEKRGIPCANGLWMLVAQAKEAAEWFTDTKIEDAMIGTVHKELQKQTENIILIGMPGCGKSTVGKLVAERANKAFVDADAEIAKLAGMSIPAIFATQGEDAFRELETSVLQKLGQQSGLVIATGGGCVTKQRNYAHLHQNGKICWLKRDIEALPTDGRPLSQNADLLQMYKTRKPLYEAFADFAVNNDRSPAHTAEEIVKGCEML